MSWGPGSHCETVCGRKCGSVLDAGDPGRATHPEAHQMMVLGAGEVWGGWNGAPLRFRGSGGEVVSPKIWGRW